MPQRVLVVDDDPIMHRVLEQYFAREGFTVVSARDGTEALERAVQMSPLVIILDVLMPGVDGLTVLRQLKANEATKRIPVIMVTVSADHLTQLESENGGAAAFLAKPFRPSELVAEVRRLMPTAASRDSSDSRPQTGR